MNILSIIYSIPAVPYSSSAVYSALADSNTTASPTTSASPSSDSSPQIPQTSNIPNDLQNQYYLHENSGHDREFDSTEAMRSVMFTLDEPISGLPSTSQHPYAIQYDPLPPPPQSNPPLPVVTRSSTLTRRVRAPPNLPPPPPPPSSSLPPAPIPEVVDLPDPASLQRHLDVRVRQRGESVGHRRTSSSGLEVLKEEYDDVLVETSIQVESSKLNSTSLVPDTPRNTKRDSHPLPPIPSPSTGSPGTPRNPVVTKPPPSPRLQSAVVPRPRGTSQLNTHSDISNQPSIINQNTSQGTISQRRIAKSSAPPTPRPSSPADSTTSSGSIPGSKPASSSLPGVNPLSAITGRSRSSSQPGRRPSLINGRISPLDSRPPLPGPAAINGTARKVSIPSKLNPNQPMPISIQTDLPLSSNPYSLVPPVFPGNLPTTPTSPLPPVPPTDPLLKPYHLMNLLRNTMTSTTGGYVTRRLHVPYEVWSQGGAKLSNVLEKVRVVAILCSALEELQVSSSEQFGAGNVGSGLASGIGSVGRKEADAWLSKLEDFSSVCDGVVTNFGKKLGVGEGFVLKKTTWGDKLTRRFDKLTNGKK